MPKVRTPKFKLDIGGLDFSSPKLKERVMEIEVEQVSDGASSFKIILNDGDDGFGSATLGEIKEGASCVIELGYYETGMKQVIEGFVTGAGQKRTEHTRKIFEVTGFDGLQKLTRGRYQRAWDKIKDTDLAGIIAGECGLGSDFEDSKIIHPHVVQNNVNNLAFLNERAKRIGFEVKVEKSKLVFKKPSRVKTGVILRWDGSVATKDTLILQRCDFNATTMGVPEEVTVRGYDPKTAKPIIGTSSNVNGGTMGGEAEATTLAVDAAKGVNTKIQISDQPVASVEEAERLAESILNQRTDNFLTGNGSCEGHPDVSCGKIIEIKDTGKEMEGEFYVTGATHTFKVGHGAGDVGYWTKFQVSRSGR